MLKSVVVGFIRREYVMETRFFFKCYAFSIPTALINK